MARVAEENYRSSKDWAISCKRNLQPRTRLEHLFRAMARVAEENSRSSKDWAISCKRDLQPRTRLEHLFRAMARVAEENSRTNQTWQMLFCIVFIVRKYIVSSCKLLLTLYLKLSFITDHSVQILLHRVYHTCSLESWFRE